MDPKGKGFAEASHPVELCSQISIFLSIPVYYLTAKIQRIIREGTVVHEDITNYYLTETV